MQTTYAQKNETAQRAADNTAAAVHDNSPQSESLQRHASLANAAVQRTENPPRPNNTGLPDDLKNGVESLSGYSLDNVRVHYNSPKPATVQALAFTQGTDIHVAPGQEHALPHEAWHVTQQMAGRVSPTTNINGMPVNDNAALEHEADVMGEKAVTQRKGNNETLVCDNLSSCTMQRTLDDVINFVTEDLKGVKTTDCDCVFTVDCNNKGVLFKIWRNLVNKFLENNPDKKGNEIYVILKYKNNCGLECSTTISISNKRLGYIVAHQTGQIPAERIGGENIPEEKALLEAKKTFNSSHVGSKNWIEDLFTKGSGDAVSKLIAERGRFECLEKVCSDYTLIEIGDYKLTPKEVWKNSDSGMKKYREHVLALNESFLNNRTSGLKKTNSGDSELYDMDKAVWDGYCKGDLKLLPVGNDYPYTNKEIYSAIKYFDKQFFKVRQDRVFTEYPQNSDY